MRLSRVKKVLATLAEAADVEKDFKFQQKQKALITDLVTIPEALHDYRGRLRDYGLDRDRYRGLGAAESQMDLYSNRFDYSARCF